MVFSNQVFGGKCSKAVLITVSSLALTSTLVGCGGGGGGSDTSTTTTNDKTVSSTPVASAVDSSTTTSVNTAVENNNTPEAAALTLLNNNRTQCGFGGLTRKAALDTTASNHANYLKLASETNHMAIASHYETVVTDSLNQTLAETGLTNDYYSGQTVNERLNPTTLGTKAIDTAYASNGHGENLAMMTYGSVSSSYVTSDTVAAHDMLMGLFAAPYHMKGLLVPQYTEVGISHQQAKWFTSPYYYTGHILEIVSALPNTIKPRANQQLLNFPCDGVITDYQLTNETPNPFGDKRDLATRPIGQPVYVLAPSDKVIGSASMTLSENGQSAGYIHVMTKDNDPNGSLAANEVVFMPDAPLKPNTLYQATYRLTYTDGIAANQSIKFTTKATS